jgi:hypothetical protein
MNKSISFWAQLCREDGTSHGATLTSGSYGTESDLAGWIKIHRREDDEILAWRRESDAAGFHDHPIMRAEDHPADPQRLTAVIKPLVEKMKSHLVERSAVLDKARGPLPPISRTGSDGFDPLVPMFTYNEAYPEEVF